jgi:poly-gamma-glutamate synthase PgsB/CapB
MYTILVLIIIFTVLGIIEFRRHQNNIAKIPIRILVNGTRGKSSVTRLITAGLQSGGIRTLGKTTGTAPRFIHPDGAEIPIHRIGKANIIEQVMVFKKAAAMQVKALVAECMAVLPPNQIIMEKQMVRSTAGVITNIRADHLDEMGPTMEDVARSLGNTIPQGHTLFTCERKYLPVLNEIAEKRYCIISVADGELVSDEMMRGFSYVEHKDNVALALAVCNHLGVVKDDALKGMYRAIPDPGVLRIYTIHHYEKQIEFVNGFAANDPDSYIIIWTLLKSFFMEGKKIIVVVNCRPDRIQRTESLGDLIAQKLRADYFILVGDFTTPLYNKAIALGLPQSKISNMENAPVEDVFQKVVSLTEENSIVIGVGNIVGHGTELAHNFINKGKEIVY